MTFVNDIYTKSLLHFKGANTSTTFTDETGKTWTANGTAQISTAQAKFETSSGLFDGNSDFITCASDDFITDVNFTIDCWIYPTSVSGDRNIFSWNGVDGRNFYDLYLNSAKLTFRYRVNNSEQSVAGATSVGANAWHHVAISRSGSTVRVFLDGVLDGSGTVERQLLLAGKTSGIGKNLYGGGYEYWFEGYIDEFRFSNGIARWITAFNTALPSAEYHGDHSASRGRYRYCGNVDSRIS
jgi:hypothetical protein